MANLLDLDRRSFLMALDELGIQGARRDDLIRQYRTRSAGLLAPAMEFGAVEPGRVRADVLPMTRPEGMTGWEAIRSGQAEFALPGLLAGLVSGAGSAVDAPRAAMAGLIPASDMASEAAGTAGMVTLGGVGGAGRQAFEYDPRAGTLYSNPVPGLLAVAERLNQPGPMPALYSNPIMRAPSGGITAWHGSPHIFKAERLVRMPDGSTQYLVGDVDRLPDVPPGAQVIEDFPMGRFRMSQIGTGEGAQAYGHGLYVAENRGVGQGYRNALSKALINNRPINYGDASDLASSWFTAMGGDRSKAIDYLQRQVDRPPAGLYRSPEEIKTMRQAIEMLRGDAPIQMTTPGGRLYEVNIAANPEEFLDWDKPLSEQPLVQQRLYDYVFGDAPSEAGKLTARSGANSTEMAGSSPAPASILDDYMFGAVRTQDGFQPRVDGPDGQRIYRDVTFKTRGEATAAGRTRLLETITKPKTEAETRLLREAGIPGVRYLDEGSRNQALAPYYNVVRESDGAVVQQKIDRGSKPEVPEGFRVEGPIDTRTRNYVVFNEDLMRIVRVYGIAGAAAMLGMSTGEVEAAMRQAQGRSVPGLLSMPSDEELRLRLSTYLNEG